MIRQLQRFALNNLSVKSINRLRKVKWFLLKPLVNDRKEIARFYESEVEVKLLEHTQSTVISDAIRPVALDIGANIGGYSYYLANYLRQHDGTCIGFEPRAETWNRLKKNVTAANFQAQRIAVSSSVGMAGLYVPASHGLSSLVDMPGFDGVGTQKVPTLPLDDFVKREGLQSIVFVKIDVEGHEFEVLEGAYRTLEENAPILLCESENRHLHPQGKSTEEFIQSLAKLNYRAFVVSRRSLQIIPVDEIAIPQRRHGHDEYYVNYWFFPENRVEELRKAFEKALAELKHYGMPA